MQVTLVTLCSSSFLALLTPRASGAGLEPSVLLTPGAASASRRCLLQQFSDSLRLTASCFTCFCPFNPGSSPASPLVVRGERSWQKPSGGVYCSWEPLGADFYLWGLGLRHVFPVTLLRTHFPQLSLNIQGGLVPGHSSSPSKCTDAQVSLRGCSS